MKRGEKPNVDPVKGVTYPVSGAPSKEPGTTIDGPSRNELARQSEAEAKEARDEAAADKSRQIAAAIGNRNADRTAWLNQIAENLDATPDRAMRDIDGEHEVDNDPAEEAARKERQKALGIQEKEARKAEQQAEEQQQEYEVEANERAATEEQEAGAVKAEPRKFKLKVNGKEVELTEEEVLERAQKVASADEYLHLASEAVKASQARAPSQDESASVGEDDIEDTLTSALQGDAEAIKKVAQRLKTPSAVTPDVLRAVDDRMDFRSAARWFRGEYKDLVEDPMTYQLVVAEDSRLAKEQPTMDYQERLKKAGDKVRTWKGTFAKPSTTPTPKAERKASVAPVPQAGGRQVVKEESDEEESVESIIETMARARHQNGAIRKPQ